MTRDEAIGLFDEWQARMAQRDATGLAQLYAPDCIVNSPIFGELKGRAAVEASNRRLYEAFPDWDMRTDHVDVYRISRTDPVRPVSVAPSMSLSA